MLNYFTNAEIQIPSANNSVQHTLEKARDGMNFYSLFEASSITLLRAVELLEFEAEKDIFECQQCALWLCLLVFPLECWNFGSCV